MLWSITGIAGNFSHLRKAVCSEHTAIHWNAPIRTLRAYGEVDARELHFWSAAEAAIVILGPAVRPLGDKNMKKNEIPANDSSENSKTKPAERHTPPSIRFSESEWAGIEKAAKAHGMTAAELVRHAAVSFAAGKLMPTTGALPSEIAAFEIVSVMIYVHRPPLWDDMQLRS